MVFDHLIAALVYGAGYERIADASCSATTMRRRRDEWARAGLMSQLSAVALAAYERMIGLKLDAVAVDGCITKAPCGGEVAGRSPVDRGKGGLKRSQLCDAAGIPIAAIPATAPASAAQPPDAAVTPRVTRRNSSFSASGDPVTTV